jgi:hypothetical protein
MAEHKSEPVKKEHTHAPSTYTMNDVFKITDELFQLSKEKQYHPGAFVHGLIFALEFAQQSYKIPQQQLAEIKRDCRRYVDEIVRTSSQKVPVESPKK